MKKIILSLFALLVAGLCILGFLRYRDYDSLKNPIDEIYYASVHYKNILGLPDMSRIIRSNTAYVGEPAWINYHREKLVWQMMKICSYISIPMVCLLFYIVKSYQEILISTLTMYMRTVSLNKMSPLLSPKFRILLFKLLLMNLKIGAMSGQQMTFIALLEGRSLHVRV